MITEDLIGNFLKYINLGKYCIHGQYIEFCNTVIFLLLGKTLHICEHTEIIGSTDRASSQQLQMWFSEHISAPKLATLSVTPIVSATVEQIWHEKMSEKAHSIQLLR